MCTQIDQRNLNELLLLDTYQGMTDAEIELVIEYRAKRKVTEIITSATYQSGIQNQNAVVELHRATCEKSHAVLESILNNQTARAQKRASKRVTPKRSEV